MLKANWKRLEDLIEETGIAILVLLDELPNEVRNTTVCDWCSSDHSQYVMYLATDIVSSNDDHAYIMHTAKLVNLAVVVTA